MKPSPENNSRSKRDWPMIALLGAVLALVTFAAYSRVSGFEFTNFDDPDYVARNEVVQRGLTVDGLKWAFTTGFMGNWHPLTWLSHMLDCELFGVSAGAHHTMSLAIHCINAVLLFCVLLRYT